MKCYFSLLMVLLIALMAIMIHPAASLAQWVGDGIPICTSADTQMEPQLVSDGNGGAIITWRDLRNGNWDIYAQKVDFTGEVLWDSNGVAICTAAGDQKHPRIITDGTGGAIITWQDDRNSGSDIYAQRVGFSGTVQWPIDGVAICTAAGNQDDPRLTFEGSVGAIITWQDDRNGSWDIYAQKVDTSGTILWTTDGVAVCTAAGDQEDPQLVASEAGGAFITWPDYRNGNWDVYAQWVDVSGTELWTTDGVAVCTATGDQRLPKPLSVGIGEVVITWMDWRVVDNRDIYAQRVDSYGTVQWDIDGVAICTAPGNQYEPGLVSDGAGGAIIAWGGFEIHARRIDTSGTVQWTDNGVPICVGWDEQWASPRLVSDEAGGAIITWSDYRNGYAHVDIYAQRVGTLGTVLWDTNGVAICTATWPQVCPQIVSDGAGGAIIAWEDYRSGYRDIYAQRLDPDGNAPAVGVPGEDQRSKFPQFSLLFQNCPNPFNASTTIKYSIKDRGHVSLRIYNVAGLLVKTLVNEENNPGVYATQWDSRNDSGSTVASGVYFYRLVTKNFSNTKRLVILK